MMKETQAIIERVSRINPQYQHVELGVDASLSRIKPGQSILVRTAETWDPYLREQWYPVGVGNNLLIIERPASTVYDPGRQIVSVLGIVGQPFRFRRTLRNVLLLAYDTPPTPLMLTIPWLLSNQVSVTLVLLGSAIRYSTRHLPAEVEVIRAIAEDQFTWSNQVMTVGWADQVFATVNPRDENNNFRAVWELFSTLRSEIPKNYLFGVFQPLLACGEGACDVCMVRSREGNRLVCTEGPAFDLSTMLLG